MAHTTAANADRTARKLVIAHADDIGMCHGANTAFAAVAGKGFITSGSVMVPCPWFREIAEMAASDAQFDLGVHLTLTSEWRHYRWRPLTGASKASGLVDDDGYMWRTARAAHDHARPDAVEAELRAQIDAALAAGIDATHLDCHMGTALAPAFADIYLRLGRDYRLPVLFPRHWDNYGAGLKLGEVDPARHAARIAELEARGHPIIDRFAETPWTALGDADAYRRMIADVALGLTFLAFHPNHAGDIDVIDPPRARCRIAEAHLLQDAAFVAEVRRQNLVLLGFRDIRDRLRKQGAL
ncbi:MAG TPA: polysaccharide deacetylase family protein [Candidatus Angelobacter sp.]|nr:polysaccharide deacetylase family protein [Candidatus Angelobacter sp.]